MANKVDFKDTDFQRKSGKTPSKQYRVTGTLSLNGKDLGSVVSGVITAPTAKQAGLYFIAHARYLGMSAVPKSAEALS